MKGVDEMERSLTRKDFLKVSGAGLVGAALLGVAGCGGEQGGSDDGPIRIAALYPTSGSLALLGEESRRGAEIARRLRNQDGGVDGRDIEYVNVDVPDVNAARQEAERLMSREGLQLFIGTYSSSLAMTATEVVARGNGTYIELGAITVPLTERDYDSVFRVNPNAAAFSETQVNFIESWLAPELGKDVSDIRLAIAHEDSDYGSSVAENLRSVAEPLNINIVTVEPYSAESNDLSPVVLRVRDSDPDIVIAVSYAQDAILLSRAASQLGLSAPLMGTGGGHSLSGFAEALGDGANGVFNVDFTQYKIDTSFTPGLEQFVDAYKEQFNEEPLSGHSLGNFMGANTVFEILSNTDGSLEPGQVQQAAQEYTVEQGTTATGWGVKFNDAHQNTRAQPYVLQWRDGELTTVFPEEPAVMQPMLADAGN